MKRLITIALLAVSSTAYAQEEEIVPPKAIIGMGNSYDSARPTLN